MSRIKFLPMIAAALFIAPLFIATTGHAAAQQASTSEPARPRSEATLRMQLVITRFEGEKKLATLPYTFLVTTGGPPGTRLRMGVDVPFAQKTQVGGAETTTIQFRSVGTDIDCAATALPDDRYKFRIMVVNTAALPAAGATAEGAAPIVRRFEATLEPVLRDGQSVQTTASTDPVTGEVVRIDVTMNVVR